MWQKSQKLFGVSFIIINFFFKSSLIYNAVNYCHPFAESKFLNVFKISLMKNRVVEICLSVTIIMIQSLLTQALKLLLNRNPRKIIRRNPYWEVNLKMIIVLHYQCHSSKKPVTLWNSHSMDTVLKTV